MIKGVMLDSGPLGQLAHHKPRPEIQLWLDDLFHAGIPIYLSEIADYEIRRSFLFNNLTSSLAILDNVLHARLLFRPITSAVMRKAAQLWADARRGTPTADPKELDADVILAAQAIEVDAIVATENIGHISQFVAAKSWKKIRPTP